MREIKFRAFSTSNKKMHREDFSVSGEGIAYWTGAFREEAYEFYGDDILMQYTGLKDKSGKEIYEGDIFSFHPSEEWKGTEPDNPCVVFWSEQLAAWMFYVGKPEMSTLLPPSESMEKIGNIYENPELKEAK